MKLKKILKNSLQKIIIFTLFLEYFVSLKYFYLVLNKNTINCFKDVLCDQINYTQNFSFYFINIFTLIFSLSGIIAFLVNKFFYKEKNNKNKLLLNIILFFTFLNTAFNVFSNLIFLKLKSIHFSALILLTTSAVIFLYFFVLKITKRNK